MSDLPPTRRARSHHLAPLDVERDQVAEAIVRFVRARTDQRAAKASNGITVLVRLTVLMSIEVPPPLANDQRAVSLHLVDAGSHLEDLVDRDRVVEVAEARWPRACRSARFR